MGKTVWKFGLAGGAVSAALMLGTMPFAHRIGSDLALLLGYTTMVLSFLLVYFGIRSYREKNSGGRITFAKGLAVGLGITAITCVFYVATWEVVYFGFMPHFMDSYWAAEVAKIKASGAGEEKIAKKLKAIDETKQMYDNPVYNAAMTFLEPLPVGLVMTLISAGVLRRKESNTEADAVKAS
ncbi:DUF4199 domain-containing protein [Acidicapsa dinghuensis]|uniref:DUF4199 domain-containing protein n=1 Tax=Acidicapsa dinghuensis TaxID=2218256 RepID=A0ABW1ECE6_9BACT|nr:DUF4199 domain-containing protein [Acidicapsa dinghuensis]